MNRLIFLLLTAALCSSVAHARDPRFIPSFDLQSEYVSGGGVVYGNLYMRGNDIYLDADDDSRFELGTDDEWSVYLNSSLVWDLDEFGFEMTPVAITESSASDRALYINPTLNDTGAPDATEDYTAFMVELTETDKTGWATVDVLHLSVDTSTVFRIDDAGVIHGANAETLDNSTDGSWVLSGVGGTNNEDIELDLEATADLVTVRSSTGVTAWDWEAIGLACGTADLSEGNLTNAGDIQADSLTADGTALQTNSSTLVLQQNADVASGGFLVVDSHADAELTAASGSQSFARIAPEILQTGSGAYTALEIDATESSVGTGDNSLLDLQVADASKLRIDTSGKAHGANAETLDNGTDGSWRMTGAGGTFNEDLEVDLEGDNLVEIKSSTGVTTIDAGAIGLACGTADLSEGNLTNAGDLQADSITADGTALQTNASTLTLQQNADVASGNCLTVDSHADAELTASSGAQSFVQIAPEIDQSGTAAYTALEIDATETGTGSGTSYLLDLQVADASKFAVDTSGAIVMGGGMSMGGDLDMNSNNITELGALHGSNSETLDNDTDGSWRMTGAGGTFNEDLEVDLEGDNLVEIKSSTGVTTIDAGAIGLACGTADLSEGNLTNAGDLQADSLTADGTALQTNASTLTLQQNADVASGNYMTVDSHADAELTAASGSQSFMQVAPEIDQSGTAAYTALEIDVTETGTGSGTSYLLDLQVADASKVAVDSGGSVGVGEPVPLALVHVRTTDVGAIAPSVHADELVLENNGATGLTLYSSNSSTGNLRFGDVDNDSVGAIIYNHSTDSLAFYVNASTRMSIASTGISSFEDYNITNVGDLQADSITADGTALQTNASTLTLQQNADVASGGFLVVDSHADAELTAASGRQSFVQIAPEIDQGGTAGYIALKVDVTESSVGSSTDYLMTLEVADAAKLTVDNGGALVGISTAQFQDNLTLDNTGTSANSPILSLKGDSAGTEVEGQIVLAYGADPYIRISVDDDDSTPTMTPVIDIHDSAISFANDNTTDIGAAGANRPKDYYGAGDITCGGSMSCVGGDFGDGDIDNVGDIALDSISADTGSNVLLTDAAGTSFGLLQLGGPTSSFPAIGRTGANVELKLADNSGRTGLVALSTSIAGSQYYSWLSRSNLSSTADGKIRLLNAAFNGFTSLTFGLETSAFPMIKRSGTTAQFRLADDSADAPISTAAITTSGSIDVGDNDITNVGDIDVDSVSADGSTVNYMDVDLLEITQEDVGATCTLNQVRVDTGGMTMEFCVCTATDTWSCAALGALAD